MIKATLDSKTEKMDVIAIGSATDLATEISMLILSLCEADPCMKGVLQAGFKNSKFWEVGSK